jgi:hypothetical protein
LKDKAFGFMDSLIVYDRKAFFLIIGFLAAWFSLAQAQDFFLNGYTEAGKRSTAEDYEEEDTDDDYTYHKHHLKFGQEVSNRLSYDISSFIYDKDYNSRDSLDNISRIFKTNWSYYIREPGHKPNRITGPAEPLLNQESLELDFKLNYKEKRYKNTPGSEYNQLKIAPTLRFKKNDVYTVDLTTGIDNYYYLEADQKDQLKSFTKLEIDRYFLDKKLMFPLSYRIEQLKQENVDRKSAKQQTQAGLDYLFSIPWIHKISTRIGWGQRDTKDDEERDDDFDYEYWRYAASSGHRINHKLKTGLSCQYVKKDYLNTDLDHRGFYIQNTWDYEVLDDDKQRLGFDFGLMHKDVKYKLKSGNDYRKETAEAGLSYKRKKNWQASIGLEENIYDFDVKDNDKKRTYILLSGEKLFLDGDLILSLDLKYRYTDYKQKDDKEQEAARIGFKYRF